MVSLTPKINESWVQELKDRELFSNLRPNCSSNFGYLENENNHDPLKVDRVTMLI